MQSLLTRNVDTGAPYFSKSKDISGFQGGLDRKFCIAAMGHLRIRGGLEPPLGSAPMKVETFT